MKILYHHRTRGDGAEGVHISEIVSALKGLGHDVEIVCPRSAARSPGLASTGTGSNRSALQPLKTLAKQAGEIAYNIVSFFRVRNGVRKHKPDFIYERYSSLNFGGIAAAKRMGVPVILEVNATFAGKFGSRHPVCFPGILEKTERYCLEQADGIVAVSHALRSCICERNVAPERIIVSPNAVNPKRVLEVDRKTARKSKRNQLNIRDDEIVVGFVGSLRQWHGIDFFADTMVDILSKNERVMFLIVGRGEYEDELRQRIASGGIQSRVKLLGAVPHSEVYPIVAAMDIGVMPDSNEFGSPMKILEYMGMGCVPVGPRLGPIEEIIEEGVTGKLFDRRNKISLINVIVDLSQNNEQRHQIASNAAEYVVRFRTWEINAQQIISLHEQILERPISKRI
ncbi:Alpha-D-kanosaminyltransferase [Rubripirellula tenax]|uniref:Alpha-D-kanosaminyltransferase n=1 Tax=Rubripirellula tenax TaxID=2528015 RepID=A0A5C6EXY3_9BACT|nr:glycosyltransferase family 4 protein [Rubripirellula tenax]TWU54493.1 Alpha-D-kanosaminyltransferase [Rubripirellula tenax]